jgi:DNA-binding response OmpR family regulator
MSWVLVAEDNDDLRDILALALRTHGYDVRAAADGAALVGIVADAIEPPAVVLLDLMMPGVDGRDGLAAIRSFGLDKRAPIVVMTGMDVRALDLHELKVAAVLQKPVSIAHLIDTVERASRCFAA